MAEYRELPMVYASLSRSLRTKTQDEVLRSIPKNFTLNAGHVKFFYDKLLFLNNRYYLLIDELKARGFNLDPDRVYSMVPYAPEFKKSVTFTDEDRVIIKKRIVERILEKPEWYRYKGAPVQMKHVVSMYS